MPAPSPKRASASMTLSWGMVAIPVQLFAGTETRGFTRSEYVKTVNGDGEVSYNKVGRVSVIKDTGEPVDTEQVIKAVEVADGIVEITDEEVEAAMGAENGTAQVICFLKQSVLFGGGYVLGDLKQLRPAKRKSGKQSIYDPAATQSFALLVAAMRKTASFCVVKVVSRGRPTFYALLPNGDFYSLLFDEEVRERLPMPEVQIEREAVEMGVELITMGMRDTAPALHDEATARIVEYAEAKARGESIPVASKQAEAAPTTDLMAQLEAAVKTAKSNGA
jgi:non-homologous end joining protein Ku